MELRHLHYFAIVAAERSFSRAAERLHIAQPPLSRQIRQLEDELKVRLLDRQRPIRLTEAGRFFYEQARQLLQRVEEIKTITQRIGKGGQTHFNIGFVASTLYENLPELIQRFRFAAPDIEMSLFEMTTLEQIVALKDGRIDIGFGRLRFDEPGITREVLLEERLAVALPRQHNLTTHVGDLKLLDTAEEPLILYPKAPRPSYADQVLSFYRDRGVEPRIAFEVRELQTALGLVAAGVGICIVPVSVCRMRRDNISYIKLREPDIVSPIIMNYRSEDTSRWLAQVRKLISDYPVAVTSTKTRLIRTVRSRSLRSL